jgi:hypothetical protein
LDQKKNQLDQKKNQLDQKKKSIGSKKKSIKHASAYFFVQNQFDLLNVSRKFVMHSKNNQFTFYNSKYFYLVYAFYA